MMDRGRTEHDVQEIFEATQQSYQAAIDNTFALQEQTLEFARSLLEATAEALQAQSENNRATLESLIEQSRKQREAMENLVRESAKVYKRLLQAPFSHSQPHQEFDKATEADEVRSSKGNN